MSAKEEDPLKLIRKPPKKMTLVVHVYDGRDGLPIHRQEGTGTDIDSQDENPRDRKEEHIFRIECGKGRQSFRWLAVTAAARYSTTNVVHGRLRQREIAAQVRPAVVQPAR